APERHLYRAGRTQPGKLHWHRHQRTHSLAIVRNLPLATGTRMNPNLDKLQPYPFERIRTLLDGLSPPASLKAISFAMGEPKHAPPEFVLDALRTHLDKVSVYPATKGIEALRAGIGQWLCRRFALQGASIDPDR